MRKRLRMGDETGKNPAAIALGRLGGKAGGAARAAKLTAQQRSDAARRAARARWGSPPSPPGWEAPASGAPARILTVAAAMFAADGYGNVSMREVARRASVGLPTLYGLFGDKAGLYQKAWLRSLENDTQAVRAAMGEATPGPDALYAFCRAICRVNSDPAQPRLLRNHALPPDDPTFAQIAEAVFKPQFDLLRPSVVALCGEAAADVKAYGLYAMVYGMIQISPVARHSDHDLPGTDHPDILARRALEAVFPEVDWREVTARSG